MMRATGSYMPAPVLHHIGSPHHKPRDYAQTPLNIYWEMTQACPLACRHCRASAVPNAAPDELSFDQGVAFLRQIGEFGDPSPQLILTGGDPLKRARPVRADRRSAPTEHRRFDYAGRQRVAYARRAGRDCKSTAWKAWD